MRSLHSCSKGPEMRGVGYTAHLLLLMIGFWMAPSSATPWRPTDDSTVLLDVPARGVDTALALAERAYRARPEDAATAQALVSEQLAAGRRLADPRYFGQAEAVIVNFLSRPNRPLALDVQWADILQHRHDYDAARRVLDEVLAKAPADAQARLMRAQMNLAQGRFADARRDCTALLRATSLGAVCLAQVIGMTGDLERGYAMLTREAGLAGGTSEVRSWILTALGDQATRLGDPAAIHWLEEAVQSDPDDQYARLALADAYIDRHQLSLAARVLDSGPRSDAALLRLAVIAAQRGADNTAARELEARYSEAEARGEIVHLRDSARFRLQARGDAPAALAAARDNFRTQREPWDVRILLEAACAVHDRSALDDYRTWQHETGYQDRTLDRLLECAKANP